MSDEIMLVFGEDGVARKYDDTWDITIHCESEEEQKAVWEKLNNSNQEAKNSTESSLTQKKLDTISRQAALDAADRADYTGLAVEDVKKVTDEVVKKLKQLPSTQPTCNRLAKDTNVPCKDAISRKAVIDALNGLCDRECEYSKEQRYVMCDACHLGSAFDVIEQLPTQTNTLKALDCVSRQDALDALDEIRHVLDTKEKQLTILPSAQPERTCVNCGRTANNGGWYADGRTRCPIEEHYALPKDGYCHLWEKRNVTDDDYPERREE